MTGCGRSGTMWVAAALRSGGIDVGHEQVFTASGVGDDTWRAEVSWFAAPFTPMDGTYVVRLVRHPLLVAASMTRRGRLLDSSRTFAQQWCPALAKAESLVEWAAAWWVEWNRLMVADETLRLDDVNAATVTRLARLVDPGAAEAVLPDRRLNAARRAPQLVPWDQVWHVPGLVDTARRYGFDVG